MGRKGSYSFKVLFSDLSEKTKSFTNEHTYVRTGHTWDPKLPYRGFDIKLVCCKVQRGGALVYLLPFVFNFCNVL